LGRDKTEGHDGRPKVGPRLSVEEPEKKTQLAFEWISRENS